MVHVLRLPDLSGRYVGVLAEPLHVVEEVLGAVGEVVLVGTQEGGLDTAVLPQAADNLNIRSGINFSLDVQTVIPG